MSNEANNRVKCLSEDSFELQMEQLVEPFLYEIRGTGTIAASGDAGVSLYYEVYPREMSKGTVVISYGFGESCLKYHELIYYFWQQGYQVAIMDHRGHGKSFRQLEDSSMVHVERFSAYVKDLHLFVEKVVKPMSDGRPLYLFGHSMGGGIGVFYLEQYPADFKKAILNAPMLRLKMGPVPKWMARTICDVKVLSGSGEERLLKQKVFDPEAGYEDSSTDSKARYDYYHKLRCQDPDYQTASASYYWGREAINAGDFIMSRKQIKKIRASVLLFTAGKDSRVEPREHMIFIDRVEKGTHVLFPDTKHEIFRAGNDVLETYLEEIFTFLEEQEED